MWVFLSFDMWRVDGDVSMSIGLTWALVNKEAK